MTTQLKLYNGALLHLGERRLVDPISDNEAETRYALDEVWEEDGLITHLLEQGLWNFAIRTAETTYSPSITSNFGYRYAFDIPTDYVRLAGISDNESFNGGPLDYFIEQDYFWTNVETIYVRYVSDDSLYGGDLARWRPSFTEWVKAYLAMRIARRVTGNAVEEVRMEKKQKTLLTEARSRDAMEEAVAYPPQGSWVRSRYGGGRGDRGNRGQLIG